MAKEIPDDISYTILSKLPVKSLNRFTCVHKSWACLLENPFFMSMFRANFLSKHHSYYDDTSLLLKQLHLVPEYAIGYYDRAPYLLSGEKFENKAKLDWPPQFQEHGRGDIQILGSGIDGIFCLSKSKKFILWNPATEEVKVIPPSRLESLPYFRCVGNFPLGFGYDHVAKDFKVIRELKLSPDYTVFEDGCPINPDPCYSLEIYSLKSNSWRMKPSVDMPISLQYPFTHSDTYAFANSDRYMNGVCYWLGNINKYGDLTYEIVLASFNLSDEIFLTTPLPLDLGDRSMEKHVVVLNGSIAVISYKYLEITFHISILGELGVKESWTKLFIVGPLHDFEYPIGAGKKGNIFFKKRNANGDIALFDLSTQKLEQNIAVERRFFDHRIIIYKESLLPIGYLHEGRT